MATTKKSKIFGWQPVSPSLSKASMGAPKSSHFGVVVLFASSFSKATKNRRAHLPSGIPSWSDPLKSDSTFQGTHAHGPLFVANLHQDEASGQDFDFHTDSPYQDSRDQLGALWQKIEQSGTDTWLIKYVGSNDEEAIGSLVGLALAEYRYLRVCGEKKYPKIQLHLEGYEKSQIQEAEALGASINLTRHLVNTPTNLLNTTTYADAVKSLFANQPGFKIEIWNDARLKKEGMGLILAVGRGAEHAPKMVHISYRPAGAKNQPIAFVGKGIVYDTGGLDIKPSQSMRLMKKDMGGSATVLGVAHWLMMTKKKQKINCDFYLALAENAIDERSYRPGDIYKARNGMSVEIHNTDAEGRLALADVLHVAATKTAKSKPDHIVNVATLTGAAKVGVGEGLGALFATKTTLLNAVAHAGQKAGDHVWPLPLYAPYLKKLKTNFAEINHCSTGRFGGAVTAALFLTQFVEKVPFVHLDIGAWNESIGGAIREAGASGQAVQALIKYVEHQKK